MPGRDGSQQFLRFGVFEADLHARELRRNGRKVPLQDKPFQVLSLLLAHPGELVTLEQFDTRLAHYFSQVLYPKAMDGNNEIVQMIQKLGAPQT